MSAYSQKRTFGTLNTFAFPPCRCAINTWSIEPANLAITVITAVLVLGVYSLVQGCARESTDLSQIGFRDRQADAFPGRNEARGILTTHAGEVIVHVEPGHLTFDAQMPDGRAVLL